MDYLTKTVKELKAICKEGGLTKYSTLRKADLIKLLEENETLPKLDKKGEKGGKGETPHQKSTARTRENAKSNEDKDIEKIISMLNDPENQHGLKMKKDFHKKFGKTILSARRKVSAGKKGKKSGDRSTHYDFQIETEDGFFNVEHKGSQKYAPIDTTQPPWKGGVQFYNGGMEKYRFALKYAEEWYNMYIGSGLLKMRYNLNAPIPSLKDWLKKDAKVQGNPGTEFGVELKNTYRGLNPGCSLTAERDEFVNYFIEKCTTEDHEMLKEDILPIVKSSLAEKHYWLQIAGDLESGKFHAAWSKQLVVSDIKKIEIEKRSDIWINISCTNDFNFRCILRFGKGSGFSNIRIDFRD